MRDDKYIDMINIKEDRRISIYNPYYSLDDVSEFICDGDIADLILLLNRKGFCTNYCCAGHGIEHYAGFYIQFKYLNNEKYDTLYNIIKDMNGIFTIENSYDITAYNDNNEFSTFITVQNDSIDLKDFTEFLESKGCKKFVYTDKYFTIRLVNDEDMFKIDLDKAKSIRDNAISSLYNTISKFDNIKNAEEYIYFKN